jgi:hypothetical protein
MMPSRLVLAALVLLAACSKKVEDKAAAEDPCVARRDTVMNLLRDARDSLTFETRVRLDPVSTEFKDDEISQMMKKDAIAFHDATEKRLAAVHDALSQVDAAIEALDENAATSAVIRKTLASLEPLKHARDGYAERMKVEKEELDKLASAPSMSGSEHAAIASMQETNKPDQYAKDATELDALESALAAYSASCAKN